MSVYDSAGFDQWGFDRDGKDAGGTPRVGEHPAGAFRPPARPAVLGPEPASPAALMHAVHDETVGKVTEKKADHDARLRGKPREGNDPEPPDRVGATTAGSTRTGVAQAVEAQMGAGGVGGPLFPTPHQEAQAAKASKKAGQKEPQPQQASSTTGAKVSGPTAKPTLPAEKPTLPAEKKAGR